MTTENNARICECGWGNGKCRERTFSPDAPFCVYCDDALVHAHCVMCGSAMPMDFKTRDPNPVCPECAGQRPE